ncbi:hypothetical protein T440DRAFT_663 [Plenodomus tracheiphilus IPT5]|uniref:F-box domain-containing protein n=1 Tax=Plenodomus tracheiphilus IPT5 TaxID=1408161 RepID=A0A6A7BM21_9PLEO|nr:hypothetical protein T440DRAFT_663 [Plenodomus tracheiphilus IPT5]
MCPFPLSSSFMSEPHDTIGNSHTNSSRRHDADFRRHPAPSPYPPVGGIAPTTTAEPHDGVKTEDSPDIEQSVTSVEPWPFPSTLAAPVDPIDPEGLLKRCSGRNKKSKQRCSAAIGKKAQQNTHPIFLPTCSAHRDQQTLAGWCQFKKPSGERCGRIFGWTPPYFELCHEHEGQSDSPSYFLRLPLEIRHEIYRYLLPTKPIGSSTAALHLQSPDIDSIVRYGTPMISESRYSSHSSTTSARAPSDQLFYSVFPLPFLDLVLVNRQICREAQDLLFSIATFTLDVRKDGTFMCGRRLLEPRRADGSSHFGPDDADCEKQRFLNTFNWSAVKNYRVDILLENWSNSRCTHSNQSWDEEVEIYDIRDYVSVVVSGILAKSKNLCKLSVRLCLAAFQWSWSEEMTLANTKLIVGPFERLRNVRQPRLVDIYQGVPPHNQMMQIRRIPRSRLFGQLCSVPTIPTTSPVFVCGSPGFDAYAADWKRWISSCSPSPLTQRAPIKEMFTSFKDFYTTLSVPVPQITQQYGRLAFLHRARVARELEDVESFRVLRNELIQYWYRHLELEEQKKNLMNQKLSTMLDCDVYPDHEWHASLSPESGESSASSSASASASASASNSKSGSGTLASPINLDSATMAIEGIPMTANPRTSGPNGLIIPSRYAPYLHAQQQQQWQNWQQNSQHQQLARQQFMTQKMDACQRLMAADSVRLSHTNFAQSAPEMRNMFTRDYTQNTAYPSSSHPADDTAVSTFINFTPYNGQEDYVSREKRIKDEDEEDEDEDAHDNGLSAYTASSLQNHNHATGFANGMSHDSEPARKRRRVDSRIGGVEEGESSASIFGNENANHGGRGEGGNWYVGKGKGRMVECEDGG